MIIVSYNDADPVTWYALQHYRNIMGSWVGRKREYNVLTLQYTTLQYCDMYSVAADVSSCRGLARVIYSLYLETMGKSPRSLKDIQDWFKWSGYIVLGPGLSYIVDYLNDVIARANNEGKEG